MQREICQISEKTNNFALQNQLINHAVEGVTEAAVKVSLLLFNRLLNHCNELVGSVDTYCNALHFHN